MATATIDDKIEEVTKTLQTATVKDDSETQITVCSWNILGTGKVSDRKKVTTETFEYRFRDDGTSLGQSDIICVQELMFAPSGQKAESYLPFAAEYGVEESQEPAGSNKHNAAMFYNKDKLQEVSESHLDKAYRLMNFKKECYDHIKMGGDMKINDAIKEKLVAWGDSDEEKMMCKEVLRECKEAGSPRGFAENIQRYMAPNETETKHPKDLLNRRMAVGVLKVKSIRDYYIIAISVHNYSGRSGTKAAANFACLLFDFLAKLQHISLHHTIVVAGDFNLDIVACGELMKYLGSYNVPTYSLTSLRKTTIDFIVVSKPPLNSKIDTHVKDIRAHDLQIPNEVEENIGAGIENQKKITNHSPLSATIEVKVIVDE